jgi:hypothetical protein
MKNYLFILSIISTFIVSPLYAGEADVINVQVQKNNKTYDFEVTVSHNDTGWDHYADKWEILDEYDSILATRVLLHPHENEQPFTRGLSGVEIPANVKWVKVRAHDSVHGYGGKTKKVNLP